MDGIKRFDHHDPAERKVPLLQKQAVRWLSNAGFADHYNKPLFASNEILTMYIVLRVTKDYRPIETFTFERLGVQTRFGTSS